MNEKDKELAVNIAEAFFGNRLPIINGRPFASVHSNPTLNLADKIGAALTTVRRETRAAAWDDAIQCVKDRFGSSVNARVVDIVGALQDTAQVEAEATANSAPRDKPNET